MVLHNHAGFEKAHKSIMTESQLNSESKFSAEQTLSHIIHIGNKKYAMHIVEGTIDLPWVAVTIDGPGPDGNEPVMVHVVAEVT